MVTFIGTRRLEFEHIIQSTISRLIVSILFANLGKHLAWIIVNF
jgi:hypothetical protein